MKKNILLLVLVTLSNASYSGCLDSAVTGNTIFSGIHGFYVARAANGESQEHYVILDKNNCTASSSGDTTLASVTKSHYYLGFKESDKALFSLLLSAQAQGIELEFRIGHPLESSNANSIMYVISPKHARSQ